MSTVADRTETISLSATDGKPAIPEPPPLSSRDSLATPAPPPVAVPVPPPFTPGPEMVETAGDVHSLPMSTRFQPAAMRKRMIHDWWQETPCWMTSLVLHLTLIVLLGMLVPRNPNRAWLAPLDLIVRLDNSREEDRDEKETGEFAVEPQAPPLPLAEKDEEPASAPGEKTPDAQEAQPGENEPEQTPGDAQLAAVAFESIVVETSDAWLKAVQIFKPQGGDPAERRRRQSLDTVNDYDRIVNDFILFDIGRLRGEEATRAVREFKTLGPAAIPALVRGLNRSASIAATCPVGVITNKLTYTLAADDDPAGLEYALKNLGRDVPPEAPHHDRIMRLRNNLENIVEGQRHEAEQVAERRRRERETRIAAMHDHLTRRGYDVSTEEAAYALDMADRGMRAIANALDDENAEIRAAAAMAASMTAKSLPKEQRLTLGRDLTNLLVDEDVRVRRAAGQTLAQMTHTGDAALLAPETQGDPQQAFEHWKGWWDEWERTELARERAIRELSMARNLDRAGKTGKAAERYEDLIRKYPDTPAAVVARQRMKNLSERGQHVIKVE